LRLGAARERLGNPLALALTATATPRVRGDIAERLRLRDPIVLIAPAHRENLRLTVEIMPGPAKFGAAGRRIRMLRRPGIIYCATTAAVDQLAGALQRARIPVVRYHGKMRAIVIVDMRKLDGAKPANNGDDEFIETYIRVNKFTGKYAETETRNVWAASMRRGSRMIDCAPTRRENLFRQLDRHAVV
jgi:hypothetical protein